METNKKLSRSIERIGYDSLSNKCKYVYKFDNTQWLESIDNYEYFNISHNSTKQIVIDTIILEFKLALNAIVFGDPAGKDYVEAIEEEKLKTNQ